MYKASTIRKMGDRDTKKLMKACNEIEHGLKVVKNYIKVKQDWHKAVKQFKDPYTQGDVDRIFKQGSPDTINITGGDQNGIFPVDYPEGIFSEE